MLPEKAKSAIIKIEVIVAAVLFFVMLISCGLYINIKLNGKTSNLPMLSEIDKKMLLRSSTSENVKFADDLLEPMFIGVVNGLEMKAAIPSDLVRKDVEETLLGAVEVLFSGSCYKINFDSKEDVLTYIEKKKYADSYVLVSFYTDLPSSIILPCISKNYNVGYSESVFLFKNLFILPDNNGNLYGCAISKNNDVVELFPDQEIAFNKIFDDSYDISDGWTRFEYLNAESIVPVISASVSTHDYMVESFAAKYGKDKDTSWIQSLFDIFSINNNLVKDFTAGDGSEINFVEEFSELVVNDNGNVVYTARDMKGILLDEYLGYIADNGNDSSLSEKIYGLKRIISELGFSDGSVYYSLVGLDYISDTDSYKIYFKYMSDGIFVFDSPYDAVFEINGDILVSAMFKVISVNRVHDSEKVLFPQKYASAVAENKAADVGAYFVMTDVDDDGIRNVSFGMPISFAEVVK